eukprot:sb/3467972/
MSEGGHSSFYIFAGGLISLVFSCLYIVRPNLHGVPFKVGLCNLTEVVETGTGECSCGSRCKASFPCLQATGTFRSNSEGVWEGVFYQDYASLLTGCTYKPGFCETSYNRNINIIDAYERNSLDTRMDMQTEFICYGHEGRIYFTDNYSLEKAVIGIAGPGILVLVGLGLATCQPNSWLCILFTPCRAVYKRTCGGGAGQDETTSDTQGGGVEVEEERPPDYSDICEEGFNRELPPSYEQAIRRAHSSDNHGNHSSDSDSLSQSRVATSDSDSRVATS